MNREIKFRLWDETQKIMYQPDQADFLIQTDGKVNSHELGILEGYFHTPQLLPLQYTGLKDKNGVEIYEDDIVTYEDAEYTLGGDWDTFLNKGAVKYDNETCSFYVSNRVSVDMETVWEDVVEVIGNIHDNPEMLEDQQ